MNYRSISDLNHCIAANLCRIPRSVDLVVGIPRSGLLVANIIALNLNLPLADLDGFCSGKILSAGNRLKVSRDIEGYRHALVVDDSIASGNALEAAKQKIKDAGIDCAITYLAVYSTKKYRDDVDIILEHCSWPRIFEWNLMNHPYLEYAALDIDGVLCVDPTEEENDDGERYVNFLRTASPLHIPARPIMALISSRLEKYRAETEAWLQKHGIQYGALYMLDLPSKAERLRSKAHGSFKASVLKEIAAEFFIESDLNQAMEIARLSGKPVISIEGRTLVPPSGLSMHVARLRSSPRRFARLVSKVRKKLL